MVAFGVRNLLSNEADENLSVLCLGVRVFGVWNAREIREKKNRHQADGGKGKKECWSVMGEKRGNLSVAK